MGSGLDDFPSLFEFVSADAGLPDAVSSTARELRAKYDGKGRGPSILPLYCVLEGKAHAEVLATELRRSLIGPSSTKVATSKPLVFDNKKVAAHVGHTKLQSFVMTSIHGQGFHGFHGLVKKDTAQRPEGPRPHSLKAKVPLAPYRQKSGPSNLPLLKPSAQIHMESVRPVYFPAASNGFREGIQQKDEIRDSAVLSAEKQQSGDNTGAFIHKTTRPKSGGMNAAKLKKIYRVNKDKPKRHIPLSSNQ